MLALDQWDQMSGVREAGSIAEKYTLRLWSAKQVRTKAAFRLWYLKHVLRGEPELRRSDPRGFVCGKLDILADHAHHAHHGRQAIRFR